MLKYPLGSTYCVAACVCEISSRKELSCTYSLDLVSYMEYDALDDEAMHLRIEILLLVLRWVVLVHGLGCLLVVVTVREIHAGVMSMGNPE